MKADNVSEEEFIKRTLCSLINNAQNEEKNIYFLSKQLKQIGFKVEERNIVKSISKDKFYAKIKPSGKTNIVATNGSRKTSKTIILNTHIDVVPAPKNLFLPKAEKGIIYGRGSCDALGQVVLILCTLKRLVKQNDVKNLKIVACFVTGEETGGNGTLSLIYEKILSDACIVLEPTNLKFHVACRGGLWFEIRLFGKATHMAEIEKGANTISASAYIINRLEKYESLMKKNAVNPLFKNYENPTPLNVGCIQGGEFHATVPATTTIKGGIGFLPGKKTTQIKKDLRENVETALKEFQTKKGKKINYKLIFNGVHNEPYELPIDEEIVKTLKKTLKRYENNKNLTGFNASCDARLYYLKAHIPTLVFGAGKLKFAHSSTEQIKIKDIQKGASILTKLIKTYSEATK